MVEQYASHNPVTSLRDKANHDPKYIEQLLVEVIAGKGFILIDSTMNGCLIAMRMRNFWCPSVWELHELVWWVDPDHRNTTIGGRLWKEFQAIADTMIAEKQISHAVSSITAGGPFIDYTKRGYKPMDASFFKE